MTNARPHALSLAVAVAISSSILASQALADRTIRTRSIDIPSDGHQEFTQSEVTVQQTLDGQDQPVHNTYTTLYPDQGPDRQGYQAPSDTFTDAMSGINGGAATVDTFRTGSDEAATGYTRLVKAGDETVFRITHNFAEQEILIEVRRGMTDEASIAAVKTQLDGNEGVNLFSGMSNPRQLTGLLQGAHARAGQLGGTSDFVELARVEVDAIEVNGRKFLHPLMAADAPPQLEDLGKTLFINDDVILTAATSAYTQVQVLGYANADINSLENLMAEQKPVGFVVLGAQGNQDQPPPQPLPYAINYPTLEVTQGSGDQLLIVHGQKVNPADVAFVIALATDLDDGSVTIPQASVPAYQQAIRSIQLQILDGLAKTLVDDPNAQFDDADATLMMERLAKFEFLHQAMVSAAPEVGDEFQLTGKDLGTTEVWMGPSLVNIWLRKFFSFKPSLRALFNNQAFIASFTPAAIAVAVDGAEDTDFAKKIVSDVAKQLVAMEMELKNLHNRQGQLQELSQRWQRAEEQANLSHQEKVHLQTKKQQVEDELAQVRRDLEGKQKELAAAQAEAQKIPKLQQRVLEARADAIKVRNTQLAAALNIRDWDDTRPPEEQARLINDKIQELMTRTGMDDAAAKAEQDVIAAILGIKLNAQDSVDERKHALQNMIQGKINKIVELEDNLGDMITPGHPKAKPAVLQILINVEEALGMNLPGEDDTEYHRRRAISDDMQRYITEAGQRTEENALQILEAMEDILDLEVYETDDIATRLARVRAELDGVEVTEELLDDIGRIFWGDYQEEPPRRTRNKKLQRLYQYLTDEVEKPDLRARNQQEKLLRAAEGVLDIDADHNAKKRGKAFRKALADQLDIAFKEDDGPDAQKQVLKTTLQALIEEIGAHYNDDGDKRDRNNEIARQLGVAEFDDDVAIEQQNRVLQARLQTRTGQVDRSGVTNVRDRIADIEAELDKAIARLGPKPKWVLDWEVATAKRAQAETENELEKNRQDYLAIVGRPGVYPISDEEAATLNNRMKQVQADLGLDPTDEQSIGDRVDDIKRYLQGPGAERRAEVREKLDAITADFGIPIEGDRDLVEGPGFLDAITAHAATQGEDEFAKVVGELPETRRLYNLAVEFFHEYDQKLLDMNEAERAQRDAQQNLNDKQQEITHYKGQNPQEKNRLENEKGQLDLRLKQAISTVTTTNRALEEHKALLGTIEKTLGIAPAATDTYEERINTLRDVQAYLGGNDGKGGKIQWLVQEQARLEEAMAVKRQEYESRSRAREIAEEAAERHTGPFQYTPEQEKLQAAMHAYMRQHSLKKQALEAIIGLSESAANSGKGKLNLLAFDFDDEFAPIRLKSLVGDDLSFNQASRIVEVFKYLNTLFPAPTTLDPEAEVQPVSALAEAQLLANQALAEVKTGAQQYDDEIHGMGLAAIHYVEHDPGYLKSFSDYFSTHSASGNKIIMLLREGIISKTELSNYMKAVRGVPGFEVVDEFEHYLGYKHRVRVDQFRTVVQMLSDDGAEEFMRQAFTPVAVIATGPAGMKESVAGMKEYAAAIITNYVLDDIAFENGRKTAAFLANVQDTLTPYAHAVGMSGSALLKIINATLMQAHAAAVDKQLFDFLAKPSAFLVQGAIWYYNSYKPLLAVNTAWQAAKLSFTNMAFLYLLDLTNRGDYLHRMLTPFQSWMERYGMDLDRTGQYAYHSRIEELTELGGLVMPSGKAASSVILLRTGTMLFARQHNANSAMYRSIFRLVPRIVKSMGSRQGIQVPLLHRVTPQKVNTLAALTAGTVLGPVSEAGAFAYKLVSQFTYAQTFGFALAAGLTYDFFMDDNKLLTQWLGGPVGRGLDAYKRWQGTGESYDQYTQRTAIATPQRYGETDEAYARRVKESNMMLGWTRNEDYLQFRERRDRTMKLFGQGWEKYFKDNVPKWSFSHAESTPYAYTLGTFYEWQQDDDKEIPVRNEKLDFSTPPPTELDASDLYEDWGDEEAAKHSEL